MEHVLAVFCGISGQRVNRAKSWIWFSPNTPPYLRHTISSAFQIPSTVDLGVYLGVPLVHGRLKKGHFKFLIERAEKRLAGWKVKVLSKAARLVLLNATFSSLPIYAMQTVAIPKSVLHHLERLCRQFFWGDELGKGGSILFRGIPSAAPRIAVVWALLAYR